jgi:hypothetical protein
MILDICLRLRLVLLAIAIVHNGKAVRAARPGLRAATEPTAAPSATVVLVGQPTTTFLRDLSVPSAVVASCGDRYKRRTVDRPCPSLDCGPRAAPAACTSAPSDIISPPFTAGLVDCEFRVYRGPACAPCGANYCNRSDIEIQPHAGECPYGFVATVADRICPQRCMPLEPGTPTACPADKPTPAPQVIVSWNSCSIRVGMGPECTCQRPCIYPPSNTVAGIEDTA